MLISCCWPLPSERYREAKSLSFRGTSMGPYFEKSMY
ncbi:hypothetical protein KUCAC02_000553 [Chaenocephalus aceratus]|uniref:Uncharacterized protein n=1 Tax=Chaenocephalus aceratus TaxID=36190 RepID=A0ACB9W5V8_CHAAC|nr:hypothetical protein KUCAC02_000553 [Chaenocephalus aceratus]